MWQDIVIELANIGMKGALFAIWLAVGFSVVASLAMIIAILFG